SRAGTCSTHRCFLLAAPSFRAAVRACCRASRFPRARRLLDIKVPRPFQADTFEVPSLVRVDPKAGIWIVIWLALGVVGYLVHIAKSFEDEDVRPSRADPQRRRR